MRDIKRHFQKREFQSKGVPNWPSQDIIKYIAEYGDQLCQQGKLGIKAEPETGR